MKPSASRRSRFRPATTRDAGQSQQEQAKDQKFFGPPGRAPFFPPSGIHRAAEAPAEEKKEEERVARAAEEKKEETVARAPMDEEKKKEEKQVAKAPEEKKEEEKISKAPEEKKAEEKVSKTPEEKKEEKVAKKGDSDGAGETTARYVRSLEGRGQPLPEKEQAFYSQRMGYDFSAVKVHTGQEAAESARDASAKAYTYGHHIVFSEGRFNPGSQEGRRLLAHELAHVVQQSPGPKTGNDGATGKAGSGAPTRESAPSGRVASAPGSVHRQPGNPTTTAAPGTAPTDPAAYRTRLFIALSQMITPTVANETLSGTLEPVLRDMGANAEWVDASGASSGGAEVPISLPKRGKTVRLRLILDDAPKPPLTGRFDSVGADVGVIRVYVRDNADPDTLATTLYHESLHLMRWLARTAPGGDFIAETGATGGRKLALEGIDPARQPRHLAMVRKHVADLALSVNASRPASDQVDGSGMDRLANFVLEEYLVRVETEVFRLMRDSDAASRRPGASVRVGTSPDVFYPRADVDKSLFEFISVFRAGDRTALTPYDRGLIDALYIYFRDRVDMFVRRRYSEVIHGPNFP